MSRREVAFELLQLGLQSLDPLLQTLQILGSAFIEARSVTPLLTQRVQGATRVATASHALLPAHAALPDVPLGCELATLSLSGVPRRAGLTTSPLGGELAHALTFARSVANARTASHPESTATTKLGTRAELLTTAPRPHAAHRGAHLLPAERAFATATAPHRRAAPRTSAALSLHAPTLARAGKGTLTISHRTGPTLLAESGSVATPTRAHPTPKRLLVVRTRRPGRTEPGRHALIRAIPGQRRGLVRRGWRGRTRLLRLSH